MVIPNGIKEINKIPFDEWYNSNYNRDAILVKDNGKKYVIYMAKEHSDNDTLSDFFYENFDTDKDRKYIYFVNSPHIMRMGSFYIDLGGN